MRVLIFVGPKIETVILRHATRRAEGRVYKSDVSRYIPFANNCP